MIPIDFRLQKKNNRTHCYKTIDAFIDGGGGGSKNRDFSLVDKYVMTFPQNVYVMDFYQNVYKPYKKGMRPGLVISFALFFELYLSLIHI